MESSNGPRGSSGHLLWKDEPAITSRVLEALNIFGKDMPVMTLVEVDPRPDLIQAAWLYVLPSPNSTPKSQTIIPLLCTMAAS